MATTIIDETWTCRRCGAPMMPTFSGSVCPHGHGGLGPVLPANVAIRNHNLILGLVDAERRGNHWYVAGVGPLEVVKKSKRKMHSIPSDGFVYGLDGVSVVKFKRMK